MSTPPSPHHTEKRYVYVFFNVMYGRNVLGAQMLEVSLVGVGTVLRLESDVWSMVKCLRLK